MSRMIPSRTTGRALVAAALLLTAGASVPAVASSTTPPPARSGSNGPVYDRVADFYGAYIDAVTDSGSGHLDTQLRAFYLTSGLRSRLATWENREHADGVLRAQDVPRAWKVTAWPTAAWATPGRRSA